MTSRAESIEPYKLSFLFKDGNCIHVEPPLKARLKFGDHGRLVNTVLLHARPIDAGALDTVEDVFNALAREVDTTSLAAALLFNMQQDLERRLVRARDEIRGDMAEMRGAMDNMEKMIDSAWNDAAAFEKRLVNLDKQLARLQRDRTQTAGPAPKKGKGRKRTRPAKANYFPPNPFREPLDDDAKQTWRRLVGTTHGRDAHKDASLPRIDAAVRSRLRVEKLQDELAESQASQSEELAGKRVEAAGDDATPTPLNAEEREAAADLVAKHRAYGQFVLRAANRKERLGGDVEDIERYGLAFRGAWDAQHQRIMNMLVSTAHAIKDLTPHLKGAEAIAGELGARLPENSAGDAVPEQPEPGPSSAPKEGPTALPDDAPVPLFSVRCEKPVDDMTEGEMRALLQCLPITVFAAPTAPQEIERPEERDEEPGPPQKKGRARAQPKGKGKAKAAHSEVEAMPPHTTGSPKEDEDLAAMEQEQGQRGKKPPKHKSKHAVPDAGAVAPTGGDEDGGGGEPRSKRGRTDAGPSVEVSSSKRKTRAATAERQMTAPRKRTRGADEGECVDGDIAQASQEHSVRRARKKRRT